MVLEIFHVVRLNQEYENEDDNNKKRKELQEKLSRGREVTDQALHKITATKTTYKKKIILYHKM